MSSPLVEAALLRDEHARASFASFLSRSQENSPPSDAPDSRPLDDDVLLPEEAPASDLSMYPTLFGSPSPSPRPLGPPNRNERRSALVGDRFRDKSLAAARRAVKQHAARRLQPKSLEPLRPADRLNDCHLQLGAQLAQRADVGPLDVGDRREAFALGRRLHLLEPCLEVAHRNR